MKKHSVLSCILFLLFFLTSGSAFAQSEGIGAEKSGMVFRAGIEVPIYSGASLSINNSGDNFDVGALFAVGPGIDLEFGFRWSYFGISIEQQFAAIMATEEALPAKWNGENSYIKKGEASFYGATYLMFIEYVPINQDFLLTFGEGLGASYGSGKNKLYATNTDAAFACKVDVGLSYFLFGQHGIGINFEIAASMAFNDGISLSWAYNPMLTYMTTF